jgi:thiamine pyrophosphokinase
MMKPRRVASMEHGVGSKPFIRTAVLICNGQPVRRSVMMRLVHAADLIVAADGGANVARRYGITPAVIIGDLDSIAPATKRHFRRSEIIRVRRQDNTDLEKALDHLVSLKVRDVTIVGITGRRIDFTLANLSVLWKYSAHVEWRVAGDDWYAVPVRATRRVRARRGTTVSLIPYGPCSGITLRGLKYPLVNGVLHIGEVAVSNVVSTSNFSVRRKRGKLLLVVLEPYRSGRSTR